MLDSGVPALGIETPRVRIPALGMAANLTQYLPLHKFSTHSSLPYFRFIFSFQSFLPTLAMLQPFASKFPIYPLLIVLIKADNFTNC